MKTLLLILLFFQPAIAQQTERLAGDAGLVVRGRVNGTILPGQTITSLEFDLLGGDSATRRTKVNLAPDGSFEASGLTAGTYEIYLFGRVVSTLRLADRNMTDLTIALKPPGPEYRFVRGRVSGTLPAGQLSTALEFDFLGGNPATRRTRVNLAPDGSFDVWGLTAGTYEVYLFGRIVSTFQLADRDIADLVFAPR